MPTNKRLKHLARQAKKQLNNRTLEERKEATKDVYKNIINSKFDGLPEITQFKKILNDYIEYGTSASGIIPISGTYFEIVYQLTLNKNHEVGAMIKYNGPTEEEIRNNASQEIS